mgnify:CR=1 FL=1
MSSLHALFLGVVIGLAGVLSALFLDPNASMPMNNAPTAAIVNGEHIPASRVQAFLYEYTSETAPQNTQDKDNFILERLIEEELLVQRGQELNLESNDPRVRGAMVDAVIDVATTPIKARPTTKDDLRAFYDENIGYFSGNTLYYIKQLYFESEDAGDLAIQAIKRLEAGEKFSLVQADLATPVTSLIPDAPLPESRLAPYLGADIIFELRNANVGKALGPHPYSNGYRIVWVADKQESPAPSFSSIQTLVETEYQRRQEVQALQAYIDWLKQRADIVRLPPK